MQDGFLVSRSLINKVTGNRMKKILFVAHENNLGGGTRSLLSLITQLKSSKNYEITVLVKKTKTDLTNILDNIGINYIYAPNFWIRSTNNSFITSLFKQCANFFCALGLYFTGKVSKKKFDIIHSNSSVISIGVILSFITNIKHVWHFREFGDLDFGLSYPMNNKKLFRFFCSNTYKFVFISDTLRNHYKDLVPAHKCKIVFNGFELHNFEFNESKFLRAGVKLLISGSFSPGKKQDTAIKAISVLKRMGINAVLYIAGSGDTKYENFLKELVEVYNISDCVDFIGYQDDISDIRREVDIELVCSRAEAFGRVTIEAMLSGLIVIASNTGANTELIRHGWNGLLYNFDDEVSLAEQIESVINDKKLRESIRNNGMKSAIEKYSISNTANCLDDLYSEIYHEIK